MIWNLAPFGFTCLAWFLLGKSRENHRDTRAIHQETKLMLDQTRLALDELNRRRDEW